MAKLKSFLVDRKPFIILCKLVSNFKKRKPFSPSPSCSTRRYLSNPTPSSLSQLSLSQARQLIRSLSGYAHQLSLFLSSFSLSCVSRSISLSIFLSAASQDPSQDLSFGLHLRYVYVLGFWFFLVFHWTWRMWARILIDFRDFLLFSEVLSNVFMDVYVWVRNSRMVLSLFFDVYTWVARCVKPLSWLTLRLAWPFRKL